MSDSGVHVAGEGSAVLMHPEPIPDRVARAADDYYPTPPGVVVPILPHLPRAKHVFDPAAGVGELLAHFPGSLASGFELEAKRVKAARAAGVLVTQADALTAEWPDVDMIVMNPPFVHAEAFVRRALELRTLDPRVTVAVLLRLSWCEPTDPRNGLPGRRQLHAAHPCDMWVVPHRPHFRPNKAGKMAGDSVTCAWFLYGPGRGGRWGVL